MIHRKKSRNRQAMLPVVQKPPSDVAGHAPRLLTRRTTASEETFPDGCKHTGDHVDDTFHGGGGHGRRGRAARPGDRHGSGQRGARRQCSNFFEAGARGGHEIGRHIGDGKQHGFNDGMRL
jgi:hypothetical protein